MKYYRLQNHLFHEGSFTIEVFDPATETWHRAGEIHPYHGAYWFDGGTWHPQGSYMPAICTADDIEWLAAIFAVRYTAEFLQPKPAIATGAAQPSLF